MFQIDNSTAATQLPTISNPGTPGFFTDGNPATGQAPTIVPAEWFNTVMMELCNAVSASGQTLTKGKLNQLALAIQSQGAPFALDTGTANTYVVNFTPAFTSRTEGQVIRFKAKTANTGASTLNDGIGSVPFVGGAHSALQGGEIAANGDCWAQWNSSVGSGGSYVLLVCTGGASQVAAATQNSHAVNLGQLNSALSSKAGIATTLAGYGITDALPLKNSVGITTQDWNTLTSPGVYDVQNGSGANMPSAYRYGVLLVANAFEFNAIGQLYMANSGEVWYRGGWAKSAWSSWKRLDANAWGDITNKPTTLAGFGITDAAALTGSATQVFSVANATQNSHAVNLSQLNSATSAVIAPGSVVHFARSTPPTGWIAADGSAISRSTYANLFSAIGVTHGAGDGSTTFNVPDLRGVFLRGVDNGRNVDPGRTLGSWQNDAIRNITGSISTPGGVSQFLGEQVTATGPFTINGNNYSLPIADGAGPNSGPSLMGFDVSRVVPTASENRPVNVALLACIKY
ncbi:phage tail protein [Chromobacterium haemolyticum]|uniref:phage tail protein n=1 Tax=Chromobacterium haemolyticum TaxID=394935 RepID=UPI000B071174|nr:phage tail protein [Chromobacterium haemolyticum]